LDETYDRTIIAIFYFILFIFIYLFFSAQGISDTEGEEKIS